MCIYEDDFHFVCECKLYDQQRFNMYNSIKININDFEILSEKEKFFVIMTSGTKHFYHYL